MYWKIRFAYCDRDEIVRFISEYPYGMELEAEEGGIVYMPWTSIIYRVDITHKVLGMK